MVTWWMQLRIGYYNTSVCFVWAWARGCDLGVIHSSQVQEQLRKAQHIQATHGAFAAILESGSVVTWGKAGLGGDSSQVQEQLRSVQHIQATKGAFAAILESGAVVTWGHAELGGDSSEVQEQL
ncbi:unnamed protein product, partial [Effrenium voratum]